MSDNNEIYYAEMEAARNSAWDAYQVARPHLLRSDHARQLQSLFHAGFERAFAMLWHGGRAALETRPGPTVEGALTELRQRLGAECQHDLLKPHPSVEVIGPQRARCIVCDSRWDIATYTAGNREVTP